MLDLPFARIESIKNMDTQEIIKRSKDLIALIQQNHGIHPTRDQLEKQADDILYWISEFVKFKVEAEQAYRLRIRDLMEKEDLSFAAAENKAMTEEVYAIYKKVKHIFELGEEKIRLLKIMLSGAY